MKKEEKSGKYGDELLEVVKMRDKMLMAISHELRTPLNAIYGFSELLAVSDHLNDIEREYVKNIRESTRALNKIVDNITDYTTSIRKETTLLEREFTVYDILEEIRTLAFMKAMEKNLEFIIWIDPSIPQLMFGDVEKINRVLLNLLLNSVKYTKEGIIALVIRKQKDGDRTFLKYEVIDTGVGIPSENMNSVFGVFARFEDDEIRTSGMGLGLTICQEYIRVMGGEITCDSKYGVGSCFSFTLETKVLNEEPEVRLKNPEDINMLLVLHDTWRQNFIYRMCRSIGIKKVKLLEDLTGDDSIDSNSYTHIFIDSKSETAQEWLEKKLQGRTEKLLLLSTDKKSMQGMENAARIFYRPFTVFMLAELFNRWSEKTAKPVGVKNSLFATKGVRALIVDDNEVNLMIASNLLRQYNIQVDQAESGTLAVKMYYNNRYDIVLIDYLMPEMDGVETTRRIRNLKSAEDPGKIIAVSANLTQDIKESFLKAGAQDILQKPVDVGELSRILRKWLPAEKIVENRSTERTIRDKERFLLTKPQKNALREVEGLDYTTAMKRMNYAAESYFSVLKTCRANIADHAERIRRIALSGEEGEASLSFHSLKGIFANIGAAALAEESGRLQKKAGLTEQLAYLGKVERFIKQLTRALMLFENAKRDASDGQTAALSKEEQKKKLDLIKKYMKNYEFSETTGLLEELIDSVNGADKKHLIEADRYLKRFCYEEALKELEKIKETG